MALKKRGYFFVLDSMLGLSIIIIGVFLIMSSYTKLPQPAQVGLIADDLLNFLSKTKIRDLNNAYAGIGGELWDQGEITKSDNSLLQQIGEFYAENKLGIAGQFISSVSRGVVPAQFNYEVWMDNRLLYPQAPSSSHIQSKEDTELLLTSKKMAFGILNMTNGTMWGPYKAEVFVWER